jgi:hypothetical protein
MGVLASGQADLTVGGDQMDPIYRVEFTEGASAVLPQKREAGREGAFYGV